MFKVKFWTIAMIAVLFNLGAAQARDQILIVGSSTVFPFAAAVAEQFGRNTEFKTPVIESTGSGGGMKLFCDGIGLAYADMTTASRRIKPREWQKCQQNGINMTEMVVGYDGIVIVNAKSAPALALSLRHIYLATAAQVPSENCTATACPFIKNPYKNWRDIDASLPDLAIEILGPPPTSGTRDAFQELAMAGGAKAWTYLNALKKKDKAAWTTLTHTVREDGVWIDAGENDNLIVNKLVANPTALGIFGFGFLDQNGDKIKGAAVDGVAASFENITSGAYPISRSLFVYAKHAHIDTIQGIKEYLYEFMSESASGEDGYLVDKGLIPLPKAQRQRYYEDVRILKKLTLE